MQRILSVSLFLAAVTAIPSGALAKEDQSLRCVPDEEFAATYRAQIEAGAQTVSVAQYGQRQLCSGTPFVRRIQALNDEVYPLEKERRDARNERMMEQSRIDHDQEELRREVEQKRADDLATARFDAELAETQWRAAVARSRAAHAALSQAEDERQLASIPSGILGDATILYPRAKLSAADREAAAREVDRILRDDARSWAVHGYVPNSVRDVQVFSRNAPLENYVLFGRFDYKKGGEGWIEIEYSGRKFKCLTINDDDKRCRQPGDSLSTRAISNFGVNVASGLMVSFISKFVL